MEKELDSPIEVIFRNNIKKPGIQPFGRTKLMFSLSILFFVRKIYLPIKFNFIHLEYFNKIVYGFIQFI